MLKKSDLNFRVYTVEAKPTTPGAENDIAIISPVPMTNWLMSPDKPSGIPRNDGDVWIRYSVSGKNTFNALKQNALVIAAISAWQYVDGKWVFRNAVSCQGGEWVDWIRIFYSDTKNYEGTWSSYAYIYAGSDWKIVAPNLTISDGIMTCSVSGSTTEGIVANSEKIDFSKYSKVRFKASKTMTGLGYLSLNVIDEIKAGFTRVSNKPIEESAMTEYEFDISSINIEGYLAFLVSSSSGAITLKVSGDLEVS